MKSSWSISTKRSIIHCVIAKYDPVPLLASVFSWFSLNPILFHASLNKFEAYKYYAIIQNICECTSRVENSQNTKHIQHLLSVYVYVVLLSQCLLGDAAYAVWTYVVPEARCNANTATRSGDAHNACMQRVTWSSTSRARGSGLIVLQREEDRRRVRTCNRYRPSSSSSSSVHSDREIFSGKHLTATLDSRC